VRDLALQFDNKVYTRMGTGFVLGLLGPIGLAAAGGVDLYQNDQRKLMNDEIKRRCASVPRDHTVVAAPPPAQPGSSDVAIASMPASPSPVSAPKKAATSVSAPAPQPSGSSDVAVAAYPANSSPVSAPNKPAATVPAPCGMVPQRDGSVKLVPCH
jgi:hypothetical protein